jgi:RNA polymerase sigma factor (sigma-70 family)
MEDTKIGGSDDQFPLTRWSAIVAARSEDSAERSRAFDVLAAVYWKPVYKYIRIRWHKSNEDAKDLTQEFFARAMEKDFFKSYDAAKARFRTFVRTCIDGFVANEEKAARRIKRGGGAQMLSFDFAGAEGELTLSPLPSPDSLEDFFEKEWLRSLLTLTIDKLREEFAASGKRVLFEIFERYDLSAEGAPEKITYATLATEFNIPETQVTNALAAARREFRRLALEKLRELTMNDEEFREEARLVFGINLS